MTKPLDDITENDPFAAESEDNPAAQDLIDVVGSTVKQAAGNSAKNMLKRFLWSIPLMFTLTSGHDKYRILYKLQRGQRVNPYEFFFGEKLTLFHVIRLVIVVVLAVGIVFFLWQNGFFAMLKEQQALIKSLATPTAP